MSIYTIRAVATRRRLAWLRECRDHAPADRAGWHHTAYHCARLGWTQWSMLSDGSIVGEELTDEGRAVLDAAKED